MKHFFLACFALVVNVEIAAQISCNGCANALVVCSGEEVCAYLTFSGGTTPYTYDFSSNVNPANGGGNLCNYTFSGSAQNVNWTVEVTDAAGNTFSDTITLTVQDPTANFSFPSGNPCSAECIPMTDQSACIDCVTYSWEINGAPVPSANNQTNPCLDLLTNGNATASVPVSLTIATSNGCTSSVTQNVGVSEAPATQIIGLPSFTQCQEGVPFPLTASDSVGTDQGSYTIVWDTNDPLDNWMSDSPPFQEPFTYPSGLFELEYCITGTNGCTNCITTQVTNLPNPVGGFDGCGPVGGCGPFDMCFEFTEISENPIETIYMFDPGDGTGIQDITNSIQGCSDPCSLNYEYTNSTCPGGPFSAQFLAMLPGGVCLTNDQTLAISVAAPPVASIQAPDEICLNPGSAVVENNSSPGSGLTCTATNVYSWYVDDVLQASQFGIQDFTASFSAPGTYEVKLEVDDFECDVATDSLFVCVTEAPTANFQGPTSICTDQVWSSENLSVLATCSHAWQWTITPQSTACYNSGDTWSFTGGTGVGSEEIDVIFNHAGTYQVSLDILGPCNIAAFSQTVSVQAPPQITTQPATWDICPTDDFCLDQLFCISECLGPLTNFELAVYAGVQDCENPTGTPVYSSTAPPNGFNVVPCNDFGSCDYLWAGPHNPGTYTVQITAENNCGDAAVCVPVNVLDLNNLNLPVPTSVCGGTQIDLCAISGACTWEVWNGSSWDPLVGCILTLNAPTQVRATCNQGNCTVQEEYPIDVQTAPMLTLNTAPGNVVCLGESITVTLGIDPLPANYNISWQVDGVDTAPDALDITLEPTGLTTIDVVLTVNHADGTSCSYPISTTVDAFAIPYVFSCPDPPLTHCANAAGTLDIASFYDTYPGDATLSCTLNGDPVTGMIDLAALPPGNYTVDCLYTAPTDPFCTDEQSCSFSITGLTTPTIIGEPFYCVGEEVELEVTMDPPFVNGTWSFISCPAACPMDAVTTPTSFNWGSTTGSVGIYEVAYGGDCLETVPFTFEIQESPPFTLDALPGNTICEGASADITLNYTGTGSITDCIWTDGAGTGITPGPQHGITVAPAGLAETYHVQVTDENGCSGAQVITINVQQQPFEWECTGLLASYCANESVAIDPGEFVTNVSSPGDVTCLLNGSPVSVPIQTETLVSDDYTISCVFTQTNAPQCSFSNSCAFVVAPLTTPTLTATPELCLNDEIQVLLSDNNGFEGNWTLLDCPLADCNAVVIGGGPLLATIATTGLGPGIYTLGYSGDCLEDVSTQVEVFPLPNFSVTADPGATICADDSLTLGINNLGTAPIQSCLWLELPLTPIDSNGDCTITVQPTMASTQYQVTATDTNNCAATVGAPINIQQQPFAFLPNDLDLCSNQLEPVPLNDFLDAVPTSGSLSWSVDGTTLASPEFIPADFAPGIYPVCYEFVHGDAPGCTFTGCFNITVLQPIEAPVTGDNQYCPGELVALEASAGFEGVFEFVACPDATCPGINSLNAAWDGYTHTATWDASGATAGSYTVLFWGDCIDSTYFDFEVYTNPTIAWTPEDDTPCLNTCMDLAFSTMEDSDESSWCVQTAMGCETLDGSICLGAYSTGGPLDICLVATANFNDAFGPYTCTVSDCQTVAPVVSPGNYPALPATACPETSIDLGVDPTLYDGCTFILGEFGASTDCGDVYIPTFGTYADTLFLAYQGCMDTLVGEIYIPEPPSASLTLDYDSCTVEAQFGLEDVSGDDLQFLWDVVYPLTDDSGLLPVPNPVPYLELNSEEDSLYPVEVQIFNGCDAITLTDEVQYVAPPNIQIDLTEDLPLTLCAPVDITFEIFLENTNYIDGVTWDFGVPYLENVTFENTVFPPAQSYQTFGVADTITTTATASNLCGEDVADVTFIIYPPDVFVELPLSLGSLCPGESITLSPETVSGDPVDQDVTISPANGGLVWNAGDQSLMVEPNTAPQVFTVTYSVFGCGDDSDSAPLEVLAEADLDFAVDGNPCVGEVVQFTNLSNNGSGFSWAFGDGGTADFINPTYVYDQPGTYSVVLTATSPDGCPTDYAEPVTIDGPDVSLLPLAPDACAGTLVNFTVPSGDFLSIEWTIETEGQDPITYVATNSIEHLFENTGDALQVFHVTVTATDFSQCTAINETDVFIKPVPNANFTFTGFENCANGALVQFENLSSPNGLQVLWDFGDGAQSIAFSPEHFYAEANNYNVTLEVVNAFNCADQHSDVLPCQDFDVFVPNAFTPDDDGINDVFAPVVYGIEFLDFDDNDYEFYIADRWGDVIFYTNDPAEVWLGEVKDGEHYAQNDVYVWYLEFPMPSGNKYIGQGRVTLVR